MRLVAASLAVAGVACVSVPGGLAGHGRAGPLYAVGYGSPGALRAALRSDGEIVRRVAAIHVAEVRLPGAAVATGLRSLPGIRFVQRVVPRTSAVEPALLPQPGLGSPYEWQFGAAHEDLVPQSALRAAASVTIAVIDTGADFTQPDLAAKSPHGFNLHTSSTDVRDVNGHGTFVSSLAVGSVTNGDGIAGFGGDAKLLVVKASRSDGTLTDVDEANAIVYAVDHGARILNLSVGGTATSLTERRGIDYAVDHDVLVVAAAGNEYDNGNPAEYPATLLQPLGSDGRGGVGLAVGASTAGGGRAFFSNTGSELSLVAPGENVFGDVSSLASETDYPRADLPGSAAGTYGFASGTSFAAPEVAGVAALVFGANPLLHADQAAAILKQSASGQGRWNPLTGYGVVDAAAAVAEAGGAGVLALSGTRSRGKLKLRWFDPAAAAYRVSVRVDRRPTRVVVAATTATSAAFTLRSGHRYLFTVAGLDGGGAQTAAATYRARG
jgi:subtilisin family serine protease